MNKKCNQADMRVKIVEQRIVEIEAQNLTYQTEIHSYKT